MEREGRRIRNWDKEFKIINVVVFGKHKKIEHDSTCIMNVPASLGMNNMSASEASPCMRATAGPPQPEILVFHILVHQMTWVRRLYDFFRKIYVQFITEYFINAISSCSEKKRNVLSSISPPLHLVYMLHLM